MCQVSPKKRSWLSHIYAAACNVTYLMEDSVLCARAFAQLPRVSREASATEAKNSALSLPYCTHSKLKRKTHDFLAAVFGALHPAVLLL